jgi:transcriptional regulator with XRE-family HTH domain
MQAFTVTLLNGPYDAAMQTGRPSKRKRTALGERLSALREQAGLSQQAVADVLGVRQQVVAYLERQAATLRPEHANTLAKLFKITVSELLGEKQSKARGPGPVGKARHVFERVSQLPRATQQRILANVEDALTAYEVRKAG